MADQKVSDLPALNGADVDAADLLYIVDSSAGSAGSKKITVGQYQLAPVSGGTANGVVYLNGSKVVTTGSELVFDGTNLGVGTSSPSYKLTVSGSSPDIVAANTGANGTRIAITASNTAAYVSTTYSGSGIPLIFNTAGIGAAGSTQMTLDSSGNLGLGVTPGTWAAAAKALDFTYPAFGMDGNGAAFMSFNARNSTGSTWVYKTTDEAGKFTVTTGGGFTWETAASGTAGNAITFTQAMTLTSGGALLVGTTAPNVSTARYNCFNAPTGTNVAGSFKNDGGSSAQTMEAWNAATTGNNVFISLATDSTFTERGSIDYNRAGGLVRYNTTSDYRAKDIIGPVQNPGATIDALKVYEGVMKGATQSRPMLIAHEAQEHAPYAVSGVKDEVNEDGTPKFQQIDVSSLVPLLLAEIQSLRARVAALESA